MKSITIFIFCISFFLTSFAQKGKVIESIVFKSNIVSYPVKYSVYLPADYETSQRQYPVLYLLHGYSDDETGWIQFGEAAQIADKGIEEGAFPLSLIHI